MHFDLLTILVKGDNSAEHKTHPYSVKSEIIYDPLRFNPTPAPSPCGEWNQNSWFQLGMYKLLKWKSKKEC